MLILAPALKKDGWSCGFRSPHLTNLVVDHRCSFSDVPLTPLRLGFVDFVLSIVNADRAVRVIEPPGDDLEGVIELPCPPKPHPPSAQVEGSSLGIEESVQATPKDASSKQSAEVLEAKAQPSMPTFATQEDTHPKVLIHGEWRKVLDSYPKDASG